MSATRLGHSGRLSALKAGLECTLLLAALVLQGCTTARLRSVPPVQSLGHADVVTSDRIATRDAHLKVMTLNVAHGRGTGFHQALQSSAKARDNLNAIARVLRAQTPDVVALQEADAPSFWSGNLDHVAYLANHAAFSQSVHGAHAEGIGLSYGTALMSRLGLRQPEAVTFDPALSPTPKGFVVSTITWPARPGLAVDVVSVHLEFSSERIRRHQAAELIQALRLRNRPVIVMGDFNTEWQNPDSALQLITRELALRAYRPERDDLETFPALGRRLDWILVSPEFEFRSYDVIPDVLSDHRGVTAELALHKAADPHPPAASDVTTLAARLAPATSTKTR
jgi:endonuclease/exonuclease/phosphatase family metal-dependent hydrolase